MLLGLGLGPAGRGPPGRAKSAGVPAPGRGPPGRGPAGRGPPGAAAPGAAPGAGAAGAVRGAAPMPVAVELNGLLPGRGPGRGACRWPGAAGRGPAAAAGRSAAVLSAAGRSSVSAGGTCGPWLWSCGNGTVTAGADRVGGAAGSDTGGGSAAGAAGAAGASGAAARAGGALPLPFALAAAVLAALAACGFADCCVAKASFSLRTTGASIVEDAERTNSPISLSLAITALLSTPNSLASSYTRTFATTLPLLGPTIRALSRSGQRVLRPASACAVHRRMLIGRSSQISAFFRSHQPAANHELQFRSLC
jgi:hypothetical protein